jgi:hypothetical protein
MEIVEAQAVREVMFDGETGRPIRSASDNATPAGPTIHPAPAGPTPGPGPTPTSGPSTGAADKMLEEFPVEFNQPK